MNIKRLPQRDFFCEFNEATVRFMIIGRQSGSSASEVLGFAESAADGYRDGRFTNLSDAAEAVRDVARRASQMAGTRPGRITINLDDPFLESVVVRGSATMEKGEEGFSEKHIEDALGRARQSMRPSDKHLVYQGVSQYLIDDEYASNDPIGIFGKELTVVLHLLFSDSSHAQNIRLVAQRAGLEIKHVFTTAHAALAGTRLPKEAPDQGFVFVLASPKVCHIARATGRTLETHASVVVANGYDEIEAAKIVALAVPASSKSPIYVTGEAAETSSALIDALRRSSGAEPVILGSAFSDGERFDAPRYSVLAGLAALRGAAKTPAIALPRLNLEMVRKLRMRAQNFVQEYF